MSTSIRVVIDKLGIILLDREEVIIRIYSTDPQQKWKLLRILQRDLASFTKEKQIAAADFVEVIIEVLTSRFGAKTDEWKIYTRNVADTVVEEISAATGIITEMLTLQREQELLCKGALTEMY